MSDDTTFGARRALMGSATLLIIACSVPSDPSQDEVVGSVEQRALTFPGGLTTYTFGSSVTVNFDGIAAPTASDWIAIATPAMTDQQFLKWQYTGGAAAGSLTFAGLPPGTYQARAYYNWPTGDYVRQQTSPSFTISGAATTPSVSAPASPTANAAFTVNYAGFPGYASDWVAVAPTGGAFGSYLRWAYTNGNASGSLNFAGLPAGSYQIRGYANWAGTASQTPIATATLTVGAATSNPVLTAPAGTAADAAFAVGFTGFPGNASDWIAVARPTDSLSTVLRWSYTNGQPSGSVSLQGLPAGEYQARAFLNWSGAGGRYITAAYRNFVIGAGSVTALPTSCASIKASVPASATGPYLVDPDGAGAVAAVNVWCDHSWDGGGWSLVVGTAPPVNLSSGGQGVVYPGLSRYMPVATMRALATVSQRVHMRTTDQAATRSVTSTPGSHPILNLRQGLRLNAGVAANQFTAQNSVWTGPFATPQAQWGTFSGVMPYTCEPGTTANYPSIYHACGNEFGLHLVGDATRWVYNNAQEPMQVYVK